MKRVLAALLALSLLATKGFASETAKYDPHAGIDPDGRIPSVNMPADIARPERWRYVPEGRIKPGNVFQRFLVSTFIAPIFRYDQDVGAGLGVALTDIDFWQKRRREFFGLFSSVTTEGQQRSVAVWRRRFHHRNLPGGGVAYEDRSNWVVDFRYEKTLTRRFFGVGADTKARDETSYTDEMLLLRVGAEAALPEPGGDILGKFVLRGEHHDLGEGRVSGEPDTGEVFPELVADADGFGGIWLDLTLAWDTRDSQHSPYRGSRLALDVSLLPIQEGGGFGWLRRLTVSQVLTVPGLFHSGGSGDEESPPTDTIALGGFVADSSGELPFFSRPTLGGRITLRGYIENRFSDRSAWHAGAEYRFWVIPRGIRFTPSVRVERIGLAAFAEAGSVGDGLDNLTDAEVHTSYGGGLRLSLERQAHFRLDLGFSTEDTNVVFAYGYSF